MKGVSSLLVRPGLLLGPGRFLKSFHVVDRTCLIDCRSGLTDRSQADPVLLDNPVSRLDRHDPQRLWLNSTYSRIRRYGEREGRGFFPDVLQKGASRRFSFPQTCGRRRARFFPLRAGALSALMPALDRL